MDDDREALVLIPPAPPRELCRPWHAGDAEQAVRDYMTAALRGDFGALDRLELTYLNTLVRLGELFVKDANGTPHWWFDRADRRFASIEDRGLAPFVVEYLRSWRGGADPAIVWALLPVCRRCAGLLRRLPCRICGGDWYVGDACGDQVITSAEGVVLEDETGDARPDDGGEDAGTYSTLVEDDREWEGA